MNKILLICLFILLVSAQSALAISSEFKVAYKYFNNGDYAEALTEFTKVDPKKDEDLKGERLYWMGIVENKLQNFDRAALMFEKSRALDFEEDDIYYEYGQSLYGSQQLEKALVQFHLSIEEEEFKIIPSRYYISYINQILEKYDPAIDYYEKIIQDRDTPRELLQSSKFQLANVSLAIIESNKKTSFQDKSEDVRDDVLPEMRSALYVDTKSDTASEINQTMIALKKKYKIQPRKMLNGRVIPDSPWKFRFIEKASYDSNVTLEGDEFTPKSTDIAALINKTELMGKFRINIKDRFLINPELKLDRVFHSERGNTSVSQNDSYNLTAAIRNTYDHHLMGKMSTALFDISNVYTARDRSQTGELIFYGRTLSFSAGERIKFFSQGNTTVKLKYSSFSAYTNSLDATTIGLFGLQSWKLKRGHNIIALTSLDFKSVENKTDSKNSYLFKGNYLIPGLFKNTILNGGLGVTLVDTKLQKATRGMEKKINPSLQISKRMYQFFDLSFGYEYIKNISKDKVNYQYSKHVASLEAKLAF
jgi:tetratricopeptide (TPR) repeat protein